MSSVLVRMRRIWRDHIAGPTLRSYDEACEDLGGVPWRPAQDETDRWFLTTRPHALQQLPSFEKLPTLDTGAINLKRSMSGTTKLLFGGGALVLAIALVGISFADGGRVAPSAATAVSPAFAPAAAAPVVATPVVAAPVVAAPAVPAPAVKAASVVKSPLLRAPVVAAPRAKPAFVAARAAALKKHLIARKRRR